MNKVIDLQSCPLSGLFYGGRAGQKEGILIEGEPWIAKYPRTTRDLQGRHLPSYTSSPISEHIGSRIYASLGIPAHETQLGYRNGKIVCACKDFTYPDKRLFEFKEIKNALSDEDEGFSSAPSDGEVILLSDVLATVELIPFMLGINDAKERFWDMFVVDALIKNPDRNNGNWGFLMTAPMTYELAPVYDLGSSLFSKRASSVTAERLDDGELQTQDAFGTNVSCYRLIDSEGGAHAINSFDYMASTNNPDLAAAITRIAEAMDLETINAIIDDIPEEAYGHILMSDPVRASHKRLIQQRFEKGILPLYERQKR
ncbi:HipA domain-containing protein [Adlercreutzia murintestinalis]|jgi:HipA-like C-terminal domain.|uniref:HipA domain-containing protein n=1 Tax=Adlercreutzia murintestinalis TaxID=2941325 RepID=UPI00203E4A33|nr:HipA domain-containing protein [Adlercreutzia murintestinalis]